MIKKSNKIILFMYGGMIIGLVLGVYGQDISYFIDGNIFNLSPVYYLTAITILSIYLIIAILYKKTIKFQIN